MEYTKLYETKDKVILRGKEGKMKSVIKPRFADNQFVKTSPKHYSQESFTQVQTPNWTDNRGWVYGQSYIKRDGDRGGSGWWNNEDLFEELTDARDILIAEKLTREEKLSLLRTQVKQLEAELIKINFSLSFLKEDREGSPND